MIDQLLRHQPVVGAGFPQNDKVDGKIVSTTNFTAILSFFNTSKKV